MCRTINILSKYMFQSKLRKILILAIILAIFHARNEVYISEQNFTNTYESFLSPIVFQTPKNESNEEINLKLNRSIYQKINSTPEEFYINPRKIDVIHLNKSKGIITDNNLFNYTNTLIKPLHYSDLNNSIQNLLLKRKCENFPCKQIIQQKNFTNIFQLRKSILNETCDIIGHDSNLRRRKFVRTNRFVVCFLPKVGSKSWRRTVEILRRIHNFPNISPPRHAINIRHPFDRLVSAYRDKFLNGKPLTSYTSEYQRDTESGESWIVRWKAYWLPALISTNSISVSTEFLKLIKNHSNLNADRFIRRWKKHAKNNISADEIYPMISLFIKFGFNAEEEEKMIDSKKNSTFSFQTFLEHVIWTFEMGFVDCHWRTYETACDLCYIKYDYILNLQNIYEESEQFLSDVGYPKGTRMRSVHRVNNYLKNSKDSEIKHKSNMNYDEKYYQDIPKVIIEKLRQIYFKDMFIFGYSIP